jgi:hypothetical protein
VGTTWEPANDTERALAAALARDDQREYFRILATAPLYLAGNAGENPQVLLLPANGEQYLAVFTSVEALTAAAEGVATRWVRTTYTDLAAHWPDPRWRLAIDPSLGIGAMLRVGDIARGARGELRLPTGPQLLAPPLPGTDFSPANAAEWGMARALADGDAGRYFDAFVSAAVLVVTTPTGAPDVTVDPDGTAVIAVFTSPALLTRGRPGQPRWVEVEFLDLLRRWSPTGCAMRINPSSPLEMFIGVDRLAEMIAAARAQSTP